MAKVLKSYGKPDMIVNAINTSYTNAIVCTPDGVSEEFDIVAGVLQGDNHTLIIYCDIILCTSKSNQWPGRIIGFYHCSPQKPKVVTKSINRFLFCG